MEQKTEQVALLRAVGFEVSEVAAMLGMTENHVNVAAFHGRKNLGKKKPKI
jgi:DNA-directed RNA polymerase specialized sigma24 family protein